MLFRQQNTLHGAPEQFLIVNMCDSSAAVQALQHCHLASLASILSLFACRWCSLGPWWAANYIRLFKNCKQNTSGLARRYRYGYPTSNGT